ncbi:hypothetical protein BJ166DRAFT_504118 [Pestalotiopsis sp. NC0098]|nr:hypothetical protein BJ166DRAFT_504118 [Pestalotiopsis sp. NC0098]
MQPMPGAGPIEPIHFVPKSHLIKWMCYGVSIDPSGRPMSRTEEIVLQISDSRLTQTESNISPWQKLHADERREGSGVQAWINYPYSALLTLDDDTQVPEPDNSHISSTALATQLIRRQQNHSELEGSLALGLFCALDGRGGRPLNGPVAAMQWLTLQLLLTSTAESFALPWSADHVRSVLARDYSQDPQRGMDIMSRIFDSVLFASTASMILIVLDQTSMIDGMSLVLERFFTKIEVMHFTPDGTALKLVVTNRSADQFRDLADKIESLKEMNVRWFG